MTCCQVSCGCQKPVLLDCIREDCNDLTTRIVFKTGHLGDLWLSITVWGGGFDDWMENTSDYLIEKVKKIVPNAGQVRESCLKLTEPFDFIQYMKDRFPPCQYYEDQAIEFKFKDNELEIEFCYMTDASKFLEEF